MRINCNEPVHIRTRKLGNGNESIFLDIVFGGKRKQEYLKLYLLAGNSREVKARNKETMKLANAVKAKRIVEIQNGKFSFENNEKKNISFLEYYDKVVEMMKKKRSENIVRSFGTVRSYVVKANKGNDVTMKDIDRNYVMDFIKSISQVRESSKKTYMERLNVVLNQAVKDGFLDRNPYTMIDDDDKPKPVRSNRVFLTIEEIKKLINADCSNENVKNFFLFSCFTGLRHCDVLKLTWSDIVRLPNGDWQIDIVQKKTNTRVTVPLSENARRWMPEEGEGLLYRMPCDTHARLIIGKWCRNAGIDKNISFHTARHTYATLLLYYGADLYTVSKLLGHTDIKTTEIYAKVMDESKRKAANLIPKIG